MTLPQEVKDMIFEYAYRSPANVTLIARYDWETHESEERFRNPHHVPRPFPAPKVGDFFVSKEYFIHAAKAYVHTHTFSGLKKDSLFIMADGIVQAYIREIEADINYWHSLTRMPNLQKLTLGVNFSSISMQEKHHCLDPLHAEDFEGCAMIGQLIKMRGLRDFKAKEFLWDDLKDQHQNTGRSG